MMSYVGECEQRMAGMGGRRGSVLVSRATTGLAAVLRALGLEKGSGVVVPVMTCATVVYAVKGAGLRPVFVDVELQEGGIGVSLEAARRCVERDGGCGALLAIPLFGGEVDRQGLARLAEENGLVVVEDAAQVGLVRRERAGRGMGACSVVSFGRGKVGGVGVGGAVLSDNEELLERARRVASRGGGGEYEARMEGVAVKVAGALEGLEREVKGRLRMAGAYRRRLKGKGVRHVGEALPIWKYSVLVGERRVRDDVTRRLLGRGIETGNLYPPLTRWFGGVEGEEYEGAKGIYERIVNLPLWRGEMGDEEGEEGEGWMVETVNAAGEVFAEVR